MADIKNLYYGTNLCIGKMDNGEPCGSFAIPNSEYCAFHQPFSEKKGLQKFILENRDLVNSMFQQLRDNLGVIGHSNQDQKETINNHVQTKKFTLESLLGNFRELNLLSSLSSTQIETAIEEIRKNNQDPEMLLYTLPNLTYGFDTEAIWTPSEYEELIIELQKITRQGFHFEELSIVGPEKENYTIGDKFTLSYSIKGKKFRFNIEYNNDWFDAYLIQNINNTLIDVGIDGAFYWINTHDQSCVLMFLDNRQYQYLREIYAPDLRNYGDIFSTLPE